MTLIKTRDPTRPVIRRRLASRSERFARFLAFLNNCARSNGSIVNKVDRPKCR